MPAKGKAVVKKQKKETSNTKPVKKPTVIITKKNS